MIETPPNVIKKPANATASLPFERAATARHPVVGSISPVHTADDSFSSVNRFNKSSSGRKILKSEKICDKTACSGDRRNRAVETVI